MNISTLTNSLMVIKVSRFGGKSAAVVCNSIAERVLLISDTYVKNKSTRVEDITFKDCATYAEGFNQDDKKNAYKVIEVNKEGKIVQSVTFDCRKEEFQASDDNENIRSAFGSLFA